MTTEAEIARTVARTIHHGVASAAQVAFGAVLDAITTLQTSPVAYTERTPEAAYQDALNDVGRAVARLMSAVAADYAESSDEV